MIYIKNVFLWDSIYMKRGIFLCYIKDIYMYNNNEVTWWCGQTLLLYS